MINIERDCTNAMVNLGIDAIRDLLKISSKGVKLTGDAAKDALLKILEQQKISKENRGGLTAVKNILASKEEIQLLRLNKEHLELLKEKAKEYGVSFGCIGQKEQEQVKIIFKASKVQLMQEVLKDIVEIEKFNKQQAANNEILKEDIIDKVLDFDYLGEDNYRRMVKEKDVDKLISIKESAKHEVKDIEILMDGQGNFYFKCSGKYKEKLDKIVDELDKKDLDEIINAAQVKAKGGNNEERKVSLKEQLEELDVQIKENVERINTESSKKKNKSNSKEDRGR